MVPVAGINGINTHGQANVDVVLSHLRSRDIPTIDVSLPMRNWISARWGGRKDAEAIVEQVPAGAVLVAHSFGAVRARLAHWLQEFSAIILIAPADGRSATWRNPSRVWCYHSRSDLAVLAGSVLPFHVFGRAGLDGYKQAGVHNRRVDSSHSDYFEGRLLREVCDQSEIVWRSVTGGL